jgi:serine/threonine protein kinase
LGELIFNKYAIQTRLAIGGMGEVFYAVQKGVPGFERPAILKSLLPDLASQEFFIEQFLDEARVAATLNHPNVVSIFEVGLWDGVYFIAMEYIQGRNLSQLMKASLRGEKPVPPVVTARIIHDAALGLHHAHTALDGSGQPLNIVHRDISPQNIMVRDDGVTKVLDFGIARASNRASRTATGAVKGKLAYMAPEQLLSEALTSGTDQFALGIVLWEMVCGQRLFKSDQELVLMKKVLEHKVIPPTQVVPGLPPEFDTITMRMLERDPTKRFESCAAVASALDQFLVSQSGEGGTREARVASYLKMLGPAEPAMPMRATPSSGAKPNFVISLNKDDEKNVSRDAVTRAGTGMLTQGAVMTKTAAGPEGSRKALFSVLGLVLAMVAGASLFVALRPKAVAPVVEAAVAPPPASAPPVVAVVPKVEAPSPVAEMKTTRLALRSSPAGASVRLDGRPVGTTPLELAVSAGEAHFLAIEKNGFRRDEREIPAGTTELEVKLQPFVAGGAVAHPSAAPKPAVPDGPGFLTLATEPWTKVSVAGEPLGSTPLYKVRLGAGTQTLTLVNEGAGINTTRTVGIKPGEVTRVQWKLP